VLAYGTDVEVEGGRVTLWGAVDAGSQREAAERVPGVSEVPTG
jgi:osmotically-inducible protein OsmY